jgi:hypothetical protein
MLFAICHLPKPTPPRRKWQIDLPSDLPSDQTRGANKRNLPFEICRPGQKANCRQLLRNVNPGSLENNQHFTLLNNQVVPF